MNVPARYRKLVYGAAIVAALVAIAVSALTAAGIITVEQINTFFYTLALIVGGIASLLARANVTPDTPDE